MANANVTFTGQANGAGALDALHLKLFAGEVITAFNTRTVAADKHVTREIQNGKSATFPATGKITAGYHTPGNEILGSQSMKFNERVITIDDLLIAHEFIANIDEAKNHYDVRGPITEQLGDALAQAYDKNVLQVGVLAARGSATITGMKGGASITAATARTDKDVLRAAYFTAAQKFDEADVPEGERYVFLLPAQYYLSAQDTVLLNRDYMGNGSISSGKIETAAGLTLVKTNNLPQTNVASGPAAYQGDFTNTAALVMQKGAVGTVRLLSLALESEYQISRQGTLMVAKYAVGHGILRPHCAVEVKVA